MKQSKSAWFACFRLLKVIKLYSIIQYSIINEIDRTNSRLTLRNCVEEVKLKHGCDNKLDGDIKTLSMSLIKPDYRQLLGGNSNSICVQVK